MEIINNIEWYFDEPKNAINRDTRKKIQKKELKTIVFDDSIKENVKFCLPLNNDFTFSQTRELPRPINVEQILTLLYNFYNEPLKIENIDKAFENNEEWREEIIERLNEDISKLTNYHVFEDTCSPDFCGINLIDEGENKGEYFVEIGPE
jgi:hypothetical protein